MIYRLGLALAVLLGLLAGPARAQLPATQCVVTAVAGGSANALTIPTLPCIPTTSLLILTATYTNTAANPTLQYVGGQAVTIFGYNSTPVTIGQIQAGARYLLTYNGFNWFILNSNLNFTSNVVFSTVALESYSLAGLSAGSPLEKCGYYAAGDMPCIDYTLQTSACSLNAGSGDGGSQIPSNTSGNCWLIVQPTIIDPRVWGAYMNAERIASTNLVIGSGNPSLTISGGAFSAANVGQAISIFDYTDPPYTGTIAAGTSGTTVVVSPAPSFNYSGLGSVNWGNDDTTKLNAVTSYAENLPPAENSYVPINFSGHVSAISGPVILYGGAHLLDGGLQAIAQGTFVADPTLSGVNGMITMTKSHIALDHFVLDAGFLPVNCIDIEAPGDIRVGPAINCEHWGQNYSLQDVTGFTMNQVDSNGFPQFEATVSSTSGLSTGMVYHQALSGDTTNLPDNTMIDEIVDSTHLVLSSPPIANISSAPLVFYRDGNGIVCGAQHACALNSWDVNVQQYVGPDPNSAVTLLSLRAGAALWWGAHASGSVFQAAQLQFGATSIFNDTGGNGLVLDSPTLENGDNSLAYNSTCYQNAVESKPVNFVFNNPLVHDCMIQYMNLANVTPVFTITGLRFVTGVAPFIPYNQIINLITNQSGQSLSPTRVTIQPLNSFASSTYLSASAQGFAGGSWTPATAMFVGGVNSEQMSNSSEQISRSATTFTFTATLDGTTNVLTGISSFSGGSGWGRLAIGQGISGTGIPSNSFITSFDQQAAVITINANTTISGTNTMTDNQGTSALQYADSGCVYNYNNGATALSVPVPSDMPGGWLCDIFVNGSGTVTLTPLGSAEINGSNSSMALSQNTLYHMTVTTNSSPINLGVK